MPTKIEKDAVSGVDTTGHEWDGVKELDTPLPKWWLYVFYATIAWSLVYFVLYPAWPGLKSHTEGLIGYSTRATHAEQLAAQAARRDPFTRRIRAATLAEIRATPDLFNFALVGGRSAFADNCAPCHGPGGGGAKGFPVLADDDWLWGGGLDAIHQTIAFGVRSGHASARVGDMPAFGQGVLTAAQIRDTSEYVYSLSHRDADALSAVRGEAQFRENCAACHGERAQGNVEFGAPNLADGIWLYGGDRTAIARTIAQGRASAMPAWSTRLDDATVKMLAIYVHTLAGGK